MGLDSVTEHLPTEIYIGYHLYTSMSPVPKSPSLLKESKLMRMFWTLFFLGSMLVIGVDVFERRQTAVATPSPYVAGDGWGAPTPRP